ncbi:hypothetical protein SEA_CAMERICO_70 [Gordonia phage Camerico]|nr:hypothetical protein SEA_CAMERICO_70 [Gordonia phage Camerico]
MKLGTFTPTASDGKATLAGYERIYIDHERAVFRSSLAHSSIMGGMDFTANFNAKFLGLIRKREMWPKRDDNSSTADGRKIARGGKQCISLDGDTGYPQLSFPWDEYLRGGGQGSTHAHNRPRILNCAECPFRKWSNDGKKGPPCQPRWYIPLVHEYAVSSVLRGEPLKPSVLELTQSGITTFKEVVKNDIGNADITEFNFNITIEPVRKNGRQFCRPKFQLSKPTGIDPVKPVYFYLLREVKAKLTDKSNLEAMGGKPGLTALKPS